MIIWLVCFNDMGHQVHTLLLHVMVVIINKSETEAINDLGGVGHCYMWQV